MDKIKTILSDNRFLSFFGGLLYASAFPMANEMYFLPGTLIGFGLFYHGLRNSNGWKQNLILVLCFSIGYYSLGYYWIPETLREFGNIPRPLNYLLGLFFSIFIIPQYIVFSLLYSHKEKFSFLTNETAKNILLAVVLTLLEYWVPQQFPAHLGHPAFHLKPYLGLAPIFGAPIYSFIGYWVVIYLYRFKLQKKIDYYIISFLFVFIFVNLITPLQDERTKTHTNINNVRLVQANIGNPMKLSSEMGSFNAIKKVYETYRNLSMKKTEKPLDLIVWPETAYPSLLSSTKVKDSPNLIPSIFQRILSSMNAEIFFGGYDQPIPGKTSYFETEYNTAFLLTPGNEEKNHRLSNLYYKMKMIPFGETLPFGPFNKFLSKYITNVSFFARGDQYTLFKTRNGTPFISVICYEILYSNFLRTYLNKNGENPQFLINLTNDSWYGDTSEPYQHLLLSKWRAIEFNLPFIRSTNTGITSIIYPDGTESKRLGIHEEGVLDIEFKTSKRSPTLFQVWGIYGNILLFFFLLLPFLLKDIYLFVNKKEV